MTDVGIIGIGAYVPYWRLTRETIGQAWGIPAIGGERAVASADEDALTMAVEAALTATQGVDPALVDAVIFASTTSPYREKQAAATIASVLDLRDDVLTMDLTDSLRSATTAVRVATDQIRAGSAGAVLVCAGDARLGEPESSFEQMLGDAGAAVLLASPERARELGLHIAADVVALASVSSEGMGPWRRADDRFVRSFEAKLETRGYASGAIAAGEAALAQAAIGAGDVDRAAIAAPDPRSQAAVAKGIGLGSVEDLRFGDIGNCGTALPLVLLTGALERAGEGETILVVGGGDGGDGIVLRTTQALDEIREQGRSLGPLTPLVEAKGLLPTYESYARNRRLVERERAPMWGSTVAYWRDLDMELPLYGMTCAGCGTIQYPQGRRCMECGAAGPHDATRLERRGRVFTFTLDHLVLGEYWNEPVPRAVVDLEGGGRLFCELTDCDPGDVEVDMPVELTFRCLHEGARFRNYYWKGRPVRVGRLTSQGV